MAKRENPRGPEPQRLRIDANWRDAVKRALKAPKPEMERKRAKARKRKGR